MDEMKDRGVVLSVLALVLVVGCPMVAAYIEYDSMVSAEVILNDPELTDTLWTGFNTDAYIVSSVDNDGWYKLDYTPGEITSGNSNTVWASWSGSDLFSKYTVSKIVITVGSDSSVVDVRFMNAQNGPSWNDRFMSMSEKTADNEYTIVFDSYANKVFRDAPSYNVPFVLSTSNEVGKTVSVDFKVDYYVTEDVVSASSIMLAIGLLLIVCAFYATPWIRIGIITHIAESGAKYTYNAGKTAYDKVKFRSKRE